MTVTLSSVIEWQRLRLLARGGNVPLNGWTLRIDRSRRTKDGTFLDAIVASGLIEVVTKGEPVEAYPQRPAQFQTTYRLTERGLHAAEYGEYKVPEPRPLPVYDGSRRPDRIVEAAAELGAEVAAENKKRKPRRGRFR